MDTFTIVETLLKTQSVKDIACKMNLSTGTIKRWIETRRVPNMYIFELMQLANIPIDYSKFSSKDKDQFFTPVSTARQCIESCKQILLTYKDHFEEFKCIEPSAGSGSFLNVLPDDTIAMDIEPKNPSIIKKDFLTWVPTKKNRYIVIGNPPFGLRGQLALKFINHASRFSEYVCFILPQLFESDGKGVPRKRVMGLNLIHSQKIDSAFFNPLGKSVHVNCIFQVWSKYHSNEMYDIKQIDECVIKIYSLSDGGTPSTTRNKKMHGKCDMYIPSTCFGKENMRYYETFDTLPRKKGYGILFLKNKHDNIMKFKSIDWSSVAFVSTNGAYNIRASQISKQFSP